MKLFIPYKKYNNNKQKQLIWYFLSFIAPCISMVIAIAVQNFYPFGKETIMSGDYITQYLPLYKALGHLIKNASFSELFWSWNKGLGGTMPSVWSFNSLSPLTLIIALTPDKFLNSSIFFTTVLRHGLCGLSFYYFLNRRYQGTNNPAIASLISLLYGMNGYLIVNQINPNFLDNLILFPVLLIGVEKILDGKRSIKYTLLLATMIIMQFYIAYMACVFIIIYSIYYLYLQNQSVKHKLCQFLRLAGYSFWAVALSSIWLIPIFYSLIDTKIAGSTPESWTLVFQHTPIDFLLKFIIGANHYNEWNHPDTLPSFYVGIISLIGIVHFLSSSQINKKDKIATFGMFFLLFSIFSNTLFIRIMHMGQDPIGFFHRNAWIISLFILIVISKSLINNPKLSNKQALLATLILFFTSFVTYFNKNLLYIDIIQSWQKFLSLFLGLLIITTLYYYHKLPKYYLMGLYAIILFDLTTNASIVLGRYLWYTPNTILNSHEANNKTYHSLGELSKNVNRIEKSNMWDFNDSLTYNYNGINHFSSSIEYSTLTYLGALGLPQSKAISLYGFGTPLTDTLLNLHYYTDNNNWNYSPSKPLLHNYNHKTTSENLNIWSNPTALGLGFSGDKSIIDLELDPKNPIQNQNNIFKTLFKINKNILTPSPGFQVKTHNLTEDSHSTYLYHKTHIDKPASIDIIFTPTDDNIFYLYAPHLDSNMAHNISMSLNGQNYDFVNRFNNPQLWAVTSKNSLITQHFTITLNNDTPVNIKDLMIFKFDYQVFKDGISKHSHLKWQPSVIKSTHLAGSIQQPAEFDYLITSIPYNNGWKAFIDGKELKKEKVFNAMLAFKVPNGKHNIDLKYYPPGLALGSSISFISSLGIIYYFKKRRI